MAYSVKVQSFEGPLDLLLQLIEENRLDITKVALAEVTEQYIQALEQAEENIAPYELADFLVIAAKLLLLKSKALMPYLVWDEDEDVINLEHQLRMYKEYFEASKMVQRSIAKKHFAFARERFLVAQDFGFQPPPGLNSQKLAEAFGLIVQNLRPVLQLPKSVIRRTVNIHEKIQRIKDLIFHGTSLSFRKILDEAKDKTDVIISFLAILELVKQRDVAVRQGSIFEDIIIERVPSEPLV